MFKIWNMLWPSECYFYLFFFAYLHLIFHKFAFNILCLIQTRWRIVMSIRPWEGIVLIRYCLLSTVLLCEQHLGSFSTSYLEIQLSSHGWLWVGKGPLMLPVRTEGRKRTFKSVDMLFPQMPRDNPCTWLLRISSSLTHWASVIPSISKHSRFQSDCWSQQLNFRHAGAHRTQPHLNRGLDSSFQIP